MTDDQTAAVEKLDHIHDEVVEAHRQYLEKIQSAFNRHCEEIGAETERKLVEVPDDGSEEGKQKRKEILEEEQKQLDNALAELKAVVNKRDSAVRKKLEDIENQRDANSLDLESELANL